MARVDAAKRQKTDKSEAREASPFKPRDGKEPTSKAESLVHLLGPGLVCDTEDRGHATPRGRSPLEILVDASNGYIPLWMKNTTLRWRFRERSMNNFANPAAAKAELRNLFAEALLAWGPAAPVKFKEDPDLWDFEFVMKRTDECTASGCVLASAFFPDSGRHEFVMYPKMFTQSRKEQVDTFIHEIGHVFGLRHFFAKVSEGAWPSEIFGTHSKFSIMNYGSLSELTEYDRSDLLQLYQLAWAGALTNINDTPIRLVRPFSTFAPAPSGVFTLGQQDQTAPRRNSRVAYVDPC